MRDSSFWFGIIITFLIGFGWLIDNEAAREHQLKMARQVNNNMPSVDNMIEKMQQQQKEIDKMYTNYMDNLNKRAGCDNGISE